MNEESSLTICTGVVVAGVVSILFFVVSCERHRISEIRLEKESMINSGYTLEPAQSERWVKKDK